MAATLSGRFMFRIAGALRTYRDWRDCPFLFDELVAFEPDVPPPPHTPEQHAEIEDWEARLQLLIKRHHASCHTDR